MAAPLAFASLLFKERQGLFERLPYRLAGHEQLAARHGTDFDLSACPGLVHRLLDLFRYAC
jgi:hypothetical protein